MKSSVRQTLKSYPYALLRLGQDVDLSQKLGVGTGKNKDNGNAAAPQVNAPHAWPNDRQRD